MRGLPFDVAARESGSKKADANANAKAKAKVRFGPVVETEEPAQASHGDNEAMAAAMRAVLAELPPAVDEELPCSSTWIACSSSSTPSLKRPTPLPSLKVDPAAAGNDDAVVRAVTATLLAPIELPEAKVLSDVWSKGAAKYQTLTLQRRCRKVGLLKRLNDKLMADAIPESPCVSSFSSASTKSFPSLSGSLKAVREAARAVVS